jgi:hypothetical protein
MVFAIFVFHFIGLISMGQLLGRKAVDPPEQYAAIFGRNTKSLSGWRMMKSTSYSMLYNHWKRYPYPRRNPPSIENWVREETPATTGCWEGWKFEQAISPAPLDFADIEERLNKRDRL